MNSFKLQDTLKSVGYIITIPIVRMKKMSYGARKGHAHMPFRRRLDCLDPRAGSTPTDHRTLGLLCHCPVTHVPYATGVSSSFE